MGGAGRQLGALRGGVRSVVVLGVGVRETASDRAAAQFQQHNKPKASAAMAKGASKRESRCTTNTIAVRGHPPSTKLN